MIGRYVLRLVLLFLASFPLALLVSSPRWNPLPICVLMPMIALVMLSPRQRPLRVWVATASIVVGAVVGTVLTITGWWLGYAGFFRTPGFQFGRTYYGWEWVYGPAIASTGGVVATIVRRVLDSTRRSPRPSAP